MCLYELRAQMVREMVCFLPCNSTLLTLDDSNVSSMEQTLAVERETHTHTHTHSGLLALLCLFTAVVVSHPGTDFPWQRRQQRSLGKLFHPTHRGPVCAHLPTSLQEALHLAHGATRMWTYRWAHQGSAKGPDILQIKLKWACLPKQTARKSAIFILF